MTTVKMEATLTFQLAIRAKSVHTGKGAPYFLLSAHDKCDVKNALLEPIMHSDIAQLLARWHCLLIDVDPSCCELDDAQLRAEIQHHLDDEKKVIEDSLGFGLRLGETAALSPCSKIPGCGHYCQHGIHLVRTDTNQPWVATHDGVEADVLISLNWVSPAMAWMPEHQHDPALSSATSSDAARAAKAGGGHPH